MSYQVIAHRPYDSETRVVHTAKTHEVAKAWAAHQSEMNEGWDGEQWLTVEPVQQLAPMPNQLTDASDFIFAGNATFTMVSKKTSKRFTYRVRRAKGEDKGRPWFVSVMTGSDNESSYTYAGCVFPSNSTPLGIGPFKPSSKKHHVSAKAPSSLGFAWLVQNYYGFDGDPNKVEAQVEIYHAGKCGRCGRKLTVPESIETGIGPECAKHI